MESFDTRLLQKLYVPPPASHKGQNGKLLLIGGSHLFHAASLWALGIASRLVDMVFYSSIPENNEIVSKAKREFRDGIVVPRVDIESYMAEADCVLIGPGMVRTDNSKLKMQRAKSSIKMQSLQEINRLEDEGLQTYYLARYLLEKYPEKKWVIDAGALQMMDPQWLKPLKEVVITPHQQEFVRVFEVGPTPRNISNVAQEYGCIVLVKGVVDIVCSPEKCIDVPGGNAGMTKGGTGDVLAGLVAALACKSGMWTAATCGSYINKKAGDELYMHVGPNFNASDLMMEIPKVIHASLTSSSSVSG